MAQALWLDPIGARRRWQKRLWTLAYLAAIEHVVPLML